MESGHYGHPQRFSSPEAQALLGLLPGGRWTPGLRYPAGQWSGTSNGIPTLNLLYAVPMLIGAPQRFSKMAFATLGTASSFWRLGIYADDGYSKPGALIIDCGQVDTASAGEKTADVNKTLSGLVWLAGVTQSVAGTISRMGTTIASPYVGSSSVYSLGCGSAYSLAGVSGPLPNPWGTSYTIVNANNTIPQLYIVP